MDASLSYEGLYDLCGPYPGTDWLGHAFHVVRLGESGRLPVCICWSSAAGVTSRWLGRGWSIPLLESRIYPIEDEVLKLHLPDGYVRHFHREHDGRLVGGRFWTAERRGEEIRVTADTRDGFPKSDFFFHRGRLAKMDCAEGSFEFRHDGQNGESVVSRGRTVLSVRPKALDSDDVRIEVGGSRILAIRRPAVLPGASSDESSSDTATVEVPCLAELVFPNGSRKTYDYGVSGSTARFTAGDETLRWDTSSRFIVARNDCRFEVGKRLNGMSGPKITRIDAEGNRESFARDAEKGVTEEVAPDGRKTITRRFTSGDNAGRVRSRIYRIGDVVQKRIDYIYDSNGRVREELVRGEEESDDD